MKKKKGFTLIELLAVIVVLAIIALIATPIVMNTIKNAKKGAAERSGESYVKQVELTIATEELDKHYVEDGKYQITSDGNLCRDKSATCTEENKIKIEMNGTKPNDGSIVIENGQVSTTGTSMEIGDYTVSYDKESNSYVAVETSTIPQVLCKAVKELSTQFVYQQGNIKTGVLSSAGDPYAYGVEYTCELGDGEEKTFYVLENKEDTVSLIMNMNIDSNGKGTTSGSYVGWGTIDNWQWPDYVHDESQEALIAKKYLKDSAEKWIKLDSNQITLPTYNQIYKAAGNKQSGLPTWLYENLLIDEGTYFAYWTSTFAFINSHYAYFVPVDGDIAIGYVFESGVRPVITLSKTQLG